MKKIILLTLIMSLIITSFGFSFAEGDFLNSIDWDERHTLEFHDNLLSALAKQYPKLAKTYPIGHTYRENKINAIELTSNVGNAKNKTGIAIIGNIHGNEQESAESASYTAWWLATNYDKDKEVKNILDNYIIYIVPVLNPDGYEQSFIYPIRQNLRPTDRNGNNIPFSDPYIDTDGDGIIADIYVGAKDSAVKDRKKIGMESLDLDKNGIFGDDPVASTIDLNRTFDYKWNYYDIEKKLGGNAWTTAGFNSAAEPEVRAIQNFLATKKVHALATLHTGIQCVLTPWCNTPEEPEDHDFMEKVAADMAQTFADTTGRKFYSKQSYNDYPTSAEMIDWAYGRLGIHAYTIEVYRGGKSNPDPNSPIEAQCTWENELPQDIWEYKGEWNGIKDVWFRKTSRAQMVGVAPPEQSLMVEGAKDAILVMIKSEPYGPGSETPEYLLWGPGW